MGKLKQAIPIGKAVCLVRCNDNNFPVQYVVIRDLVQNFIALSQPNRHISKEQGVFGLAMCLRAMAVCIRVNGSRIACMARVTQGGLVRTKEMVIICRRFLVCSKLSQDVK